MKNIINFNGTEYIKKSKYDSLEKKKKVIINEKLSFSKQAISNPTNTLCIFPLDLLEGNDKLDSFEISEYKEFDILGANLINSSEENLQDGIFNPRMEIGNHIYSYEYLQEAKNIINALGHNEDDFKLFIHKSKKGQPLLIKFYQVGVFIAPRVEVEDAKGDKRE